MLIMRFIFKKPGIIAIKIIIIQANGLDTICPRSFAQNLAIHIEKNVQASAITIDIKNFLLVDM